MRRDLLGALAAVVAIALVSLLSVRAPQGPKWATHDSSDFSFGGYRAWYDLMAREGAHVDRFRSHHDALPATQIDTLVMSFPTEDGAAFWNRAERDALLQWVRAGGRLIDIGLTPPTERAQNLRDESVLGEEVKAEHGALFGPWSTAVATLEQRSTLRLRPQPHHRVDVLLRDRAGALVAHYALGRGDVVAIASAATFENRALDHGDAARLAYLAAQPRRPGGIVAFDETIRGGFNEKAWYRALDTPELLGLAFLAFAGILWLAYGAFGLGPPVRLRAPREPTSREFLDAVAALYGRARARDRARVALVADARRSLERSPASAENLALGARVAAAGSEPVQSDATLLAIAQLARTAREETIRAGRNAAPSTRRAAARGVGAGRRRR
jgi:hypothetical protein